MIVDENVIATTSTRVAIGEVTYRTAGPATATVQVTEAMQLLRFNADKLRAFVQKNQDIGAISSRTWHVTALQTGLHVGNSPQETGSNRRKSAAA